ncbi:MAG TPA: S-adenosylmethionine:tRNA ribosyltransferase-isomerase [Blastocatellia bacterium]|nr:S-adenosylmethionine:tRNA ribosyltransferase-isomerase [Blastocatellia bacterium]
MIAAQIPTQRPPDARLMIIDFEGSISQASRASFVDFLRAGDLVIANNAATLPASLQGEHLATRASIEVRLAGRRSLAGNDLREFCAIVFGAGDFRTRTEDRPLPPKLAPGDRLSLGPLAATVDELLGHPRLISLRFDGDTDSIWAGLARHGRPIQYSHVATPLSLWEVWTSIAGPPVAFEPPSAGFALDWRSLRAMRDREVAFSTITHAAGISSTGDPELDQRLPLDEPYRIPESTACAIRQAQSHNGKIVAIGTTVVRALEHAAGPDGSISAGDGLATGRIDAKTRLRVVDAILSGTHEPGTSHYQLLRAFVNDDWLNLANNKLDEWGFRTHEYGDSVLIERSRRLP